MGTKTGAIRRKAYLQDGEEWVIAEKQITCDGAFEDTPGLGRWRSELDDEEADKNGVVLVSRCIRRKHRQSSALHR
jgi:hypothetical protein